MNHKKIGRNTLAALALSSNIGTDAFIRINKNAAAPMVEVRRYQAREQNRFRK